MKVSLERLPESRVLLDIEVDQERLEKSLQVAYRKVANRARIPGFRPGKAPRHIVERAIGREGLIREALDQLVPDVYNDVIKEHDVDAIDQPELEIVEIEPVRFKATVPIRPTVDLGDYLSIRVTEEEVAFDASEADEHILRFRRQHATHVPVEREAQYNDMVIASVKGTVDREDTDEPAAAAADMEIEDDRLTFVREDDAEFTLREGQEILLPGFVEGILGMKPGESKTLELAVPEDFRIPRLAGKTAQLEVELKELKEEQLPDADDEFATTLNPEFETFQQLQDDIVRQLRERAENEAKQKYQQDVVDRLMEVASLEYPRVMVEHEIDHVIRDATGQDLNSYRTYLQSVGRSEEEFRETFREAAELRVKRGLVLGKLAEVENIEPGIDDVTAEIEKMFAELGEEDARLRPLFDSESGRDTVRRDLLNRRTLDRLVAIAKGEVDASPKGEAEASPSPESEAAAEPVAAEEESKE